MSMISAPDVDALMKRLLTDAVHLHDCGDGFLSVGIPITSDIAMIGNCIHGWTWPTQVCWARRLICVGIGDVDVL